MLSIVKSCLSFGSFDTLTNHVYGAWNIHFSRYNLECINPNECGHEVVRPGESKVEPQGDIYSNANPNEGKAVDWNSWMNFWNLVTKDKER